MRTSITDNKKYYEFFQEIFEQDLVENYYFQWLMPEKLPTLNDRIEKEIATLENLKFQNMSYYDDLIDQIKYHRTINQKS